MCVLPFLLCLNLSTVHNLVQAAPLTQMPGCVFPSYISSHLEPLEHVSTLSQRVAQRVGMCSMVVRFYVKCAHYFCSALRSPKCVCVVKRDSYLLRQRGFFLFSPLHPLVCPLKVSLWGWGTHQSRSRSYT